MKCEACVCAVETPSVCALIEFSFVFVCSLEKMAQNIREEITRLHRRKQLNFTYSNCERMQDSESSGSEMGPDSPRRPDTPPNLVRNAEKGLFTFKQVSGFDRITSGIWSRHSTQRLNHMVI